MELTLLGQKIKQEKVVTYLGCEIDESLTWAKNTEKMVNKATPVIFNIKRLVRRLGKLAPNVIHETMDSLFNNIFSYLCPIYVNMADMHWKKIEVLHRKMLKIVYGLPDKISNEMLYEITGETPIRETLNRQAAKRIPFILNNMPDVSNYLYRYQDFQHTRKYEGLLEYYMSNPLTNFVNHYGCPLCCFRINHPCVYEDPLKYLHNDNNDDL